MPTGGNGLGGGGLGAAAGDGSTIRGDRAPGDPRFGDRGPVWPVGTGRFHVFTLPGAFAMMRRA